MIKIHELSPRIKEKIFYAAVIVLVAFLAFGLGRLSAFYGQALRGQGSGFQITYPAGDPADTLQ